MATYKIFHPTTNKVVNLYATSASGSIANGARLLLYNWENNNDQKWELESVGGYAIFRIARDRNKVMNRHSTNNNAHVWHYDGSYATQQDSVVNTETTNGNMRIKLVHRNLYLTKNANDNYLSWAAKTESNRQYFKMEEVSGGGTTGGIGLNFLRPLDASHPLTAGFSAANLGLDIDGVIGESIRAAGYGKVIFTNFACSTDVSKIESIGRTVFIEHYNPNGTVCGMTGYSHMDRIDVQVGQYVSEGANIGTVGNTGRVIAGPGGDGSHLHFSLKTGTYFNASNLSNVYNSGVFVNPAPYIMRA